MDVLKRNLFKVSGIEKDAKLTEATSGPFSIRSIRYHLPLLLPQTPQCEVASQKGESRDQNIVSHVITRVHVMLTAIFAIHVFSSLQFAKPLYNFTTALNRGC